MPDSGQLGAMSANASAGVPVLAPTGDLDLHSSRELAQHLSEMAGAPEGDAVLDLSGLDSVDSSGLGVVLKGVSRFSRQGKRLILVVPEGNVSRVFDFAGARDRVMMVATRDEAMQLAGAER